MMAQVRDQSSRWCFTLNNYDRDVSYKDHFLRYNHVKRSVWGYEVAPQTGTPHLQGYVEYKRSYRINICQQILPRARWSKAITDARTNYNYCIKGGAFDTTGDWTVGGVIALVGGDRPASVPMLIASLLNPMTALQTKVSPEFAVQHNYLDRITKNIKRVRKENELFNEWKNFKLYNWQYMVSRALILLS